MGNQVKNGQITTAPATKEEGNFVPARQSGFRSLFKLYTEKSE
jgi:hypothetical protein